MAQLQAKAGGNSGSTTNTITFDSASAAGSTLLLLCAFNADSIAGVADSTATAWTLAPGSTSECRIYYRANAPAGVTSVTATYGWAAASQNVFVERDDIALASPADTGAYATGTSSAWSTGSVSTAADNEIAFGVVAAWGAYTYAEGAGWTDIAGTGLTDGMQQVGSDKSYFSQRLLTAAGSYSFDGTFNGPDTWKACVATFVLQQTGGEGQIAAPDADVSAGAWTPSTGSDLYAMLDETTASDSDYINVNSNSECIIGLSAPGATPGSGTKTLSYRHKGSPVKKLIAKLYDGTTLIQSFTHDPCPSALTDSAQTITNAISSYADLRLRFETADATSPPTPSVSFGAIGTIAYSASGGASVAPGYPASIEANDKLILLIGMKPSTANSGSVTTPGGWTAEGSITGAGGYGTTLGADTGNTNLFVFSKTAAGTESGTLSVTVSTNNVCWGAIIRCDGNLGADATWSVAMTTGSDTSSGNVSIAMGADPGVTAGDLVIGAMCIPTDVSTPSQFSAEAFSQTGVTFGTVTERAEPDSNVGNDIGGFICTAPVSSGTSSAAPTMTATAGGTTTNVRGPGVFVRVRTSAPTEAARVTWASMTVPAGGGTNYDVSISESATADASIDAVVMRAVTVPAEAASSADVISAVASLLATIAAEAATASDAISTTLQAPVTLGPETASGGDSINGGILASVTLGPEAASAADSENATRTMPVTLGPEAASGADALSTTLQAPVTLGPEAASAAESISTTLQAPVTIATEAASGADSINGITVQSVTVPTEAASAADSISTTVQAAVSLSEAASATDTISALLAAIATLVEAASSADAIGASKSTSGTLGPEAANATESLNGSQAINATLPDETASAADVVSTAVSYAVQVVEAAGASDLINASAAWLVAIAEAATALDAISTGPHQVTLNEPADAQDFWDYIKHVRIYAVSEEDRAWLVAAEDRVRQLIAESRTSAVDAELRLWQAIV